MRRVFGLPIVLSALTLSAVVYLPGQAVAAAPSAPMAVADTTAHAPAALRTTAQAPKPVTALTAAAPAAKPVPARALRVLAILATWSAPDALTRERAQHQLFKDSAAWYAEVSYGRMTLSGDVTPWVRIAGPDAGLCYKNHRQVMEQAKAAARAAGYDAGKYDKTLVYFPRSPHRDCGGYTGWAYVGGTDIWLHGRMDRKSIVHELGHALGLRHASSLQCKDGATPTVLDGTCAHTEYGDIADAMGQSGFVGQFSAPGKETLGWLGSRTDDVTGGGRTVLSTLGDRRADTVAAKIRAGKRTYYLEYRRATGVDSHLPARVTDGLVVHVVDPTYGANPMLLDLNPGGSLRDAALRPGSSWTTPEGVVLQVGVPTATGLPITVS